MYFIREQRPNNDQEKRSPRKVRPEYPTELSRIVKRPLKRAEFTRLKTGGVVPD